MLKRVLVLIILTPLLFNGVWATVHLAENDHHSTNVAHLHINTKSHSDVEHHNESVKQTNENESSEHDHHKHFHIQLSVYLKSDDMSHFENRASENPSVFNSQLTSVSHAPPVRPPLF